MTDKELKRLKRSELLELLVGETRENLRLKEENRILQEKLEERRIDIENAGSIAEASLKINGVFETAQNAAEQYMENIRSFEERSNAINSTVLNKIKKALKSAERKASEIIKDAEARAAQIIEEAEDKALTDVTEAQALASSSLKKAEEDRTEMIRTAEAEAARLRYETGQSALDRAKKIIEEAEMKAAAKIAETDAECEKRISEAQEAAEEYMKIASDMIRAFAEKKKGDSKGEKKEE